MIMKNKLIKISLVTVLVLGLGGLGIKAADEIIATMGNKEVNVNEGFNQAKISSQGQAFFDLIDSEILNAKYSYEKNDKVKAEVDKEIETMKQSNPNAPSEYGVKDMMELMKKTGGILKIQRDQYTRDQYNKLYVTEESLRKLYDNREGELTSYAVIKFDANTYEGDTAKFDEDIKAVESKLASATKDNVRDIFAELAKTYPGAQNDPNGERNEVDRSQVEPELLKIIDKYKYLEFSKQPHDIGGVKYFILKIDKGERMSFAASKQRLTDLQYDQATQNNQYLTEYLLVQMREKNKISFTSAVNKKIYDAAIKQVITNYNNAKDGAK